MKIGIDARFYGVAGPGRYVSNLIRELEILDKDNDYVIFVTKKASAKYHPKNPRFKKWVADYHWYTFEEQISFLIEILRARLDLLHVPFFNIPVLYPKKTVVTIHDLIMHEFKTREGTTLPQSTYNVKYLVYKIVSNWATIKAKKIIVPTNYVKEDLIKKLKFFNGSKVIITAEGVDPELLKHKPKDGHVLKTRLEEMHIKDKYFLYVGSAYPHKNIKTLIIAYKELLREAKFRGQLVIAGKVDVFSNKLATFVHGVRLEEKVVFAAKYGDNGYVKDKDLAYLYRGALAYVFGSLKEGFSITPLEAQAFGIPVLLSDIPAHKEVFGDSALYFDPNSTLGLAEKMLAIANDKKLREMLIKKGTENVKKYSWKKMAQETLKIYKGLI